MRSAARTFGSVFVQGARGVCELQHTANGGDGRAHGGACVSGSGSAAVGGGISEASVLLSEHRCGLPEAGGRYRDAGSAARHSGREHKYGARSAERRGVICAPLQGGAECACVYFKAINECK